MNPIPCRAWIPIALKSSEMPRWILTPLIITWIALGGCAAQRPLVEGHLSPESVAVLDAWLLDHPLTCGENIRVDELERTARASTHVVQIRNREPLHIHVEHDLDITLRRGRGTLIFGDQRIKLRMGDFFKIPRGVAHAFINDGVRPAVAYAEFSPPFDGVDSLAVD